MTLTTASALIYSILLLLMAGIDALVVYFAFRTDYGNPKDGNDRFIGINLKKYIKILLIAILYPLVLITLNLMNAAATAVTDITQFSGIIGFLFSTLLAMTWPFILGIIVWIAIAAWKDAKLLPLIKEYLEFRDVGY